MKNSLTCIYETKQTNLQSTSYLMENYWDHSFEVMLKTQMPTLIASSQHCPGGPRLFSKERKRNKMYADWNRKTKTETIIIHRIIVCEKNI